jgi:hypothetical protein
MHCGVFNVICKEPAFASVRRTQLRLGLIAPPGGKGPSSDGGKESPFSHEPPEGYAKTMSAVLGEIVWLMSQSPLPKQFFISDLEWFAMTFVASVYHSHLGQAAT